MCCVRCVGRYQVRKMNLVPSGRVDEEEEPKTDEKSRRDAHGRFEAEPWHMRVLKYAQISRRVPTASIAANISDVLAAYAPELADAPQPTERCLRLMRSEVTIAGEAMAAFRVGKAKRIICATWRRWSTSA